LRQAFVREFVDGGCVNAKAAATRAGYSEGSAASMAYKLLQDPVIAAAVAEVKAGAQLILAAPISEDVATLPPVAAPRPSADRAPTERDLAPTERPNGVVIPGHAISVQRVTGVDIPNVVLGIARVAFADPRKLFNDDGSPKAITDLDDDTALAIESVEVIEQYAGSGEERVFTGYVKKYRFSRRGEAQDKLMKYLNAYKEHEKGKGEALAGTVAALLGTMRRSALPVVEQVDHDDPL
jgi:hypothetical protein